MLLFFKVLSLIASPCIAIAVAVIAWRQWETARQKLILDLFKERVEVYEMVIDAISLIERDGWAKDNEIFRKLHPAKAKAQFFFGKEVPDYIQGLISLAAKSYGAGTSYNAGTGDHKKHAADMHDCIIGCAEAREQLQLLFAPYMKMDQRLPGAEPHLPPSLKTVSERQEKN